MDQPRGIMNMFSFHDSRKVGIGLWHYLMTNLFYILHAFPSWAPGFQEFGADAWQLNTILAMSLIGGGTIVDSIIEKKFGITPAAETAKAATTAAAAALAAVVMARSLGWS